MTGHSELGGSARGESSVRIVTVHPDLLGTYGDGGNGVVLAQRLRWRGFAVELIEADSSRPIPASGDIYCLGGGEDGPQFASAQLLSKEGALSAAVNGGAAVLAVCAGFQIIGESFPTSDGNLQSGVGLIDARTSRGTHRRAVGELLVRPTSETGLEELTGYENHGGVTSLGPDVKALGFVERGIGNGAGRPVDGALVGRVVCTYMHGPVLARNAELADLIASWIVGPLSELDDSDVKLLKAERVLAASGPNGKLKRGLRPSAWLGAR